MQWKLIYILLFLTICLYGCATAKGFQKDVNNAVNGITTQDGWIHKSDQWIKDHMW